MTDGTSQGLFVVVAIVIFGVFVALSYTVFGNDGLSGGITGLFETAIVDTEEKLNKTVKPNSNDNLIDINNIGSYVSYHSGIHVVSDDEFYVVRNVDNTSGMMAIRSEGIQNIVDTYTVSGFMYINGEPVTYEDFYDFKRITTYAESLNFFVDDATGYFENTQTNLTSRYFLRTRIAYTGTVSTGDVITFRHLKLEHGSVSTNEHKP